MIYSISSQSFFVQKIPWFLFPRISFQELQDLVEFENTMEVSWNLWKCLEWHIVWRQYLLYVLYCLRGKQSKMYFINQSKLKTFRKTPRWDLLWNVAITAEVWFCFARLISHKIRCNICGFGFEFFLYKNNNAVFQYLIQSSETPTKRLFGLKRKTSIELHECLSALQ